MLSNLQSSDILKDYSLERIIGRGAEGIVYYGVHKSSQIHVAIKQVKKYVGIKNIIQETQIQASINHKNVPKIFNVLQDNDYIYIIQEYVCGIELFDILAERKLNDKECRNIIHQLLNILEHIHSLGIVHGDIKPENILYNQKQNKIYLIDFGSARWISNRNQNTVTGGSLGYMSPELITGSPSSIKSDIWAVGVLLYTISTGYPPFFSDNEYRNNSNLLLNAPFWYFNNSDTQILKDEICTGKLYHLNTLSSSLSSIIESMLSINPENRKSAQEYLLHPYICKVQATNILSLHFQVRSCKYLLYRTISFLRTSM